MALNDIFTIPFLISLGITLFLVSLLSIFFLQRLNEQNHKISSMLELVTTMAEELNFIRGRLQIVGFQQNPNQYKQQPNINIHSKINVSDDEDYDEDDEEEEDEDDEDDDEDEDDDDYEDDDNNEEDDEEDEENPENIKVVKLDEDFNINYENLNQSEEQEKAEEKEIITVSNDDLLKQVDLNNETSYTSNKEFEIQDYKKLSLSKLKSIVIEKGLVADADKLNKKKLLNLLGIE